MLIVEVIIPSMNTKGYFAVHEALDVQDILRRPFVTAWENPDRTGVKMYFRSGAIDAWRILPKDVPS